MDGFHGRGCQNQVIEYEYHADRKKKDALFSMVNIANESQDKY